MIAHMTVHTFRQELWLPASRQVVFSFFSDARNLEAITPPWLNFEIVTPGEIRMHAGALIDYRLRVRRIPLRWQTEITLWEPTRRFIDEQRRGPYRLWRHEHAFVDLDGGTLCCDEVEYSVPGGALVNWLLVRREIEKIFAYRAAALSRRFPPGG
jgi:ligand-binding SRPBCC domain-containing protein